MNQNKYFNVLFSLLCACLAQWAFSACLITSSRLALVLRLLSRLLSLLFCNQILRQVHEATGLKTHQVYELRMNVAFRRNLPRREILEVFWSPSWFWMILAHTACSGLQVSTYQVISISDRHPALVSPWSIIAISIFLWLLPPRGCMSLFSSYLATGSRMHFLWKHSLDWLWSWNHYQLSWVQVEYLF